MAKHTPAATTQWVAEDLRKAEHVSKVDVLDDQVLRVERSEYAPFIAGIVSERCVYADDIEPLVKSTHEVEIIANVPKESYWTGGALRLARDNRIATGAFGDLYRVISESDVRGFQQREIAFISGAYANTTESQALSASMTGFTASTEKEGCPT